MVIDLADQSLFGNDNAEDEDSQVLASYFYSRPEFLHLSDPSSPLAIVRAYKGEGKSALLRMLRISLEEAASDGQLILIESPAPDIAPNVDGDDPTLWFQAWKRVLSKRIVAEIGRGIGFAATDDASLMVEEAIDQGHAGRDFVAFIGNRLKTKGQLLTEVKPRLNSPEMLLRRWQRDGPPIWLLLDDIDLNYQSKQRDRCRVGQFFIACRSLAHSIKGLRIRSSIRPMVWANARMYFADLNKLEQYTRPLNWNEDDLRGLIAKRVIGYLNRRGQLPPATTGVQTLDERQLVALLFEDPMLWNQMPRAPEIPLTTMSWNRPRWLVELCKEAARRAVVNRHERITLRDLENVLPEFGTKRFLDTVGEFRVRSPQVNHLMSAFADGPALLTTESLLKFAEQHLVPIAPVIDGESVKDPLKICAFLYEIGFITAREDSGNGYRHLRYAEKPMLLASRSDIDKGYRWELHLTFRKYLHLRGSE